MYLIRMPLITQIYIYMASFVLKNTSACSHSLQCVFFHPKDDFTSVRVCICLPHVHDAHEITLPAHHFFFPSCVAEILRLVGERLSFVPS